MLRPIRSGLFLVLTLILVAGLHAQDSTVYKWSAASRKLGEGKYALDFRTTGAGDYYLYSPDQQLLDLPAATLVFRDSAIRQDGAFTVGSTVTKEQAIGIFDNARFRLNPADAVWTAIIVITGPVPARLQGELGFNYGRGDEFLNGVFPFTTDLEGGQAPAAAARILVPSINIDQPLADCGDVVTKDTSYMKIFLLGLLGGIIALFTPCVFPMIPLTVSFFTGKNGQKKKNGTRNAIIYGFFIFLIYLLITIPFHIAGRTNPAIFNNISTNVWLNLVFFVIFVVFAISFFGAFEITLPASFANKVDERSGLGNIAGIFFMALTLAIVSFSCTGPILGTLLAGVADGGAWPLTAGAAGFGLALGLPFALFALFPNWLQSIPKSGGWMTNLKVVLGFVELALAVKFLANADNVQQWGILEREIFIGLWIIIGTLIVLYLLGILRTKGTPRPKLGPVRIIFILLFGAFTLYLVPGVTNTRAARLNLISGFPPPLGYSVYKDPVNAEKPLLDYAAALKLSRELHKPILIDFTGWACVNCRRMEEKVWTNKAVEKLMKQDYILVSLYVDERTRLPATERQVYTMKSGEERSLQTVGDKWTAFQVENFGATSQPQYAIVSPDEQALAKTKFYTPDAEEFRQWLECGLRTFNSKK